MFLFRNPTRSRLRFCYLSWSLIVPLLRATTAGAAHLFGGDRILPDLCVAASAGSTRATTCFLDPVRIARLVQRRRRRLADDDGWTTTTNPRTQRMPRTHVAMVNARRIQAHTSQARSTPGVSGRKSVQNGVSFVFPSHTKLRRRRAGARFAHGLEADADDNSNEHNEERSAPTDDGREAQELKMEAAVQCQTLRGVERVYCLSDLHTDHLANLEWLRHRMKRPPPQAISSTSKTSTSWSSKDLLVIAGDISHSLPLLETTLEILLKPGCRVLFVAGNHEAWRENPPADNTRDGKGDRGSEGLSKGRNVGSSSRRQPSSSSSTSSWSSLDKIDRVYETCRRLGVIVDPCIVPSLAGGPPGSSLHIVPLQSWYDGSLSFAPDLEAGFETWPWVDFARCEWPSDRFPLGRDRIPQGLVEHFLETNRPALDAVLQHPPEDPTLASTNAGHAVMTVSHFLPNFRTLPDWKELDAPRFDRAWLDHGAGEMSAKFAKVAGSAQIDEQIRTLRAPHRRQLHVFGHSHRPKDFEWSGIRYVHNPLGKPRERELHMINPDVDFQLLWDATTVRGEVVGERVLRYWDERGGGKEALWERLEQNQSLRTRGRYNNPPTRR